MPEMESFMITQSIDITPWCVKIETALEAYPNLANYLQNGKLDFGDHESLSVYNKAIAFSLADILVDVPSTHLIPAVCLRHAYLKVLSENYLGGNKSILEIGTGSSAIMAMLAAKLYDHQVVATEINDVSHRAAFENISSNQLLDKISLTKSHGGIIDGVIPKMSQFDALITYPPTYADTVQDEGKMSKLRGFKGVKTEMIGGGEDGYNFTRKLLEEACSDNYQIKYISVLCLFKSHVEPSMQIMQKYKENVDVIELLAGTRKRYIVIGF